MEIFYCNFYSIITSFVRKNYNSLSPFTNISATLPKTDLKHCFKVLLNSSLKQRANHLINFVPLTIVSKPIHLCNLSLEIYRFRPLAIASRHFYLPFPCTMKTRWSEIQCDVRVSSNSLPQLNVDSIVEMQVTVIQNV